MQVLSTVDNTDSDVLVGQMQAAQGFTVADDSVIMGLLSTALYANPLKSMLQEVLFNAWDAHKASGITDTPICIELDEETGITITDYGNGISKEDMFGVYCVYAGTTKNKDDNQTGGFGLGCKSPFAYTESFNVTSCNQGVKSLYLIVRSSDEAGGMPACTPLVSTPTEETGLSVNIPLHSSADLSQAVSYVKEICYLSGIKINVIRFSKSVLIESEEVLPGEYHIGDTHAHEIYTSGIFAVYGGVKYLIPAHPDYAKEFDVLHTLRGSNSLFIGFAPNTLTPLPSREGLNNSGRGKENLQSALELCVEQFQGAIAPLCKEFAHNAAVICKGKGIPASFALYAITSFLKQDYRSDNIGVRALDVVKANADYGLNTVTTLVTTLSLRPKLFYELLGFYTVLRTVCYAFAKEYPEQRSIVLRIAREGNTAIQGYAFAKDNYFNRLFQQSYLANLYAVELEIRKALSKEPSHIFDRRIASAGRWLHTSRDPSLKLRDRYRTNRSKPNTRYVDPDVVYVMKDRSRVTQVFQPKTVILAKSIATLNQVNQDVFEYFNLLGAAHPLAHRDVPAMGYVVHATRGKYGIAKQKFLDAGYTVIEAPEPETKARSVSKSISPHIPRVKKANAIPEYPLVDTYSTSWESDTLIADPTHYFYATKTDIREGMCASASMLRYFTALYPKTVIVHNKVKAAKLAEKGIIPFHTQLADFMLEVQADPDLMHQINYLAKLKEDYYYAQEAYLDPIAEPLFGMPLVTDPQFKLKYILAARLIDHGYMNGINQVRVDFHTACMEYRRDHIVPLMQPIKALDILDNSEFNLRWLTTDDTEKRTFVDGILAFINSI